LEYIDYTSLSFCSRGLHHFCLLTGQTPQSVFQDGLIINTRSELIIQRMSDRNRGLFARNPFYQKTYLGLSPLITLCIFITDHYHSDSSCGFSKNRPQPWSILNCSYCFTTSSSISLFHQRAFHLYFTVLVRYRLRTWYLALEEVYLPHSYCTIKQYYSLVLFQSGPIWIMNGLSPSLAFIWNNADQASIHPIVDPWINTNPTTQIQRSDSGWAVFISLAATLKILFSFFSSTY